MQYRATLLPRRLQDYTTILRDLRGTANLMLWAIYLVLNPVPYFILGLIVVALWNKLEY
jgi:hypothetical protein